MHQVLHASLPSLIPISHDCLASIIYHRGTSDKLPGSPSLIMISQAIFIGWVESRSWIYATVPYLSVFTTFMIYRARPVSGKISRVKWKINLSIIISGCIPLRRSSKANHVYLIRVYVLLFWTNDLWGSQYLECHN